MTAVGFAVALQGYPKFSPSQAWGARVRKGKLPLSPKIIRQVRRNAAAAANDFVGAVKTLPRREQILVAEALIEAAAHSLKQLAPSTKAPTAKGYPEYNPDQARGEGGQWTAGGAARAVGSAAGTVARAGGKYTYLAMREALSTITLVPSSRTTVSEALNKWWAKYNDKNIEVHIDAVSEAGTRLMFTIIIGALAWALARAFLYGAAGAVGTAVGEALRLFIR